MNPQTYSLKQKLLALYQQLLSLGKSPMNQTSQPPLYLAAVSCLNKHVTLNNSVPIDVGCAEAVSYVMSLIGVKDGPYGIPGTLALYKWLNTSNVFLKIPSPEKGCIVVFPTGLGNGAVEGHTGVVGNYGVEFPNDWTVMSNNSDNGLLQTKWSIGAMIAHYQVQGGIAPEYFRYIGNGAYNLS